MYCFFSQVPLWRIDGDEFNGFQIIESPPSVSTVNMSDLRLEGKELSVSSPFEVYATVEKKRR